MSTLVVELKADPDDVDTWELTVRISYREFSGEGSCYVSGHMVRDAAQEFSQYPLSASGNAKLESGYGTAIGAGLSHVMVHISLAPNGNVGKLVLRVVVASDEPIAKSVGAARLELLVPFEYEQAAALSRGLLSLLGKNVQSFELILE